MMCTGRMDITVRHHMGGENWREHVGMMVALFFMCVLDKANGKNAEIVPSATQFRHIAR